MFWLQTILKVILIEFCIIIRISSYTIDEGGESPNNIGTSAKDKFIKTLSRRSTSTLLSTDLTEANVNLENNTVLKDTCTGDYNCLSPTLLSRYQSKCPSLYPNIKIGYLPNGEPNLTYSSSGKYLVLDKVHTLEDCVGKCCFSEVCNFATLYNNTCYLFYCNKEPNSCIPREIPSPRESPNSKLNPKLLKTVFVHLPYGYIRANTSCEYGIDTQCFENEICISKNSRSRNGHCQCKENYLLSISARCVKIPSLQELEELDIAGPLTSPSSSTTTPSPLKALEVSVSSKNITLPDNEVTLYAYAVPQAPPESPYSYEWNLISHPSQDPATTEGKTTSELHLSGVIQGSYTFQISVRGQNAIGSANATVTVYPQKRNNQPPIAVITPANQTIQLPTNSAILDGTSSTDDDKIVSYKWEVQKGPIDFKFPSTNGGSTNSSTLQIKDLVPGNFTFKLTVEDGDHATNSTTADINVLKEIDYPPTANAGTDIVIYLPQTEVTLNGNASTDDKKIVQWEWKATGDEKKAVDMQDSHSAYLKLSGLEEGMYVFELTVTDEAGQSSKSVVHVFVKKPSGNPPKAYAGEDSTITLPLNWVLLDASQSKADGKVVKWKWSQQSGPNNSTIFNVDEAQANATGLTKGDYLFQVDIEDDAKLASSSQVKVTVTQKTNEPPKSNAGDDVTVTLPCTLVQINGTKSSDDVKITEWKWDRDKESSAAANVVENSDTSPNLQVTNLVPGKYVFKLTVKDEQGLSDEDSVLLTVLEDPLKSNQIEIVLDLKISELTENNKEKFLQQLSLLVQDTKLIIHHVSGQERSGLAVVVLYGKDEKDEIINGVSLANELTGRLKQDKALLAFTVLSIDTVLCLDPCSGHGVCHDFASSRQCVCDPFWMENYFKKHFESGHRNCEWSKIYVGVVACLLVLMISAVIWSLVILFQRNVGARRRGDGSYNGKLSNGFLKGTNSRKHNVTNGTSHKKQYTLLDDDEIEMEIKADEPDTDESDSGESLIFQRNASSTVKLLPTPSTSSSSNSIPNSSVSINNGGKKINGILKKGRSGINA